MKTFDDRIIKFLSWGFLFAIWVLVLTQYFSLPGTIPIHFNLYSEPDGYGSKKMLFLLPAISTGIFILLTVINRATQKFNYPTKITPENAQRQFSLAKRMIGWLRLIIAVLFFLIALNSIRGAKQQAAFGGPWLIIALIVSIFITVAWYLISAMSTKYDK